MRQAGAIAAIPRIQPSSSSSSSSQESAAAVLARADAQAQSAVRPLLDFAAQLGTRIPADPTIVRNQLERLIPHEQHDSFRPLIDGIVHLIETQRNQGVSSNQFNARMVQDAITRAGPLVASISLLQRADAPEDIMEAARHALIDFFNGSDASQRQAYTERGQYTAQLIRYFTEHQNTFAESSELMTALGQQIINCGRAAGSGSPQEARTAIVQSESVMNLIRPQLAQREASAATMNREAVGNLAGVCDDLLHDVRDDTLRAQLEAARTLFRQTTLQLGRDPPEQIGQEDRARVETMAAFVHLTRELIHFAERPDARAENLRLEEILGHGLAAVSANHPEQAQLHHLIARNFSLSETLPERQEFLTRLSNISESLAAGRLDIAGAQNAIRETFNSELGRFSEGREFIRHFLASQANRNVDHDLLVVMSDAIALGQSMQSLLGNASGVNTSVRAGSMRLFNSAFHVLENGAPSEHAFAFANLARQYVDQPPQMRDAIVAQAASLERGANVVSMNRLTHSERGREALSPLDAARRVLDIGSDVTAADPRIAPLMSMFTEAQRAGVSPDGSSIFVRSIEAQTAVFLTRLSGFSELVAGMRRIPSASAERAIYSATIQSLQSYFSNIAANRSVSSQQQQTLDAQASLIRGRPDQIAQAFATSENPEEASRQAAYASHLSNMHDVLSQLRGREREEAAGIYRRAFSSLSNGDSNRAAAYAMFAQAYTASRNRTERDTLLALVSRMDRIPQSADDSALQPTPAATTPEIVPLTTEDARWLARTYMTRVQSANEISDTRMRANFLAYSELSIAAFNRGDRVGANSLNWIADLYARSSALDGREDVVRVVRTIPNGFISATGLSIPSLAILQAASASQPPRTFADALLQANPSMRQAEPRREVSFTTGLDGSASTHITSITSEMDAINRFQSEFSILEAELGRSSIRRAQSRFDSASTLNIRRYAATRAQLTRAIQGAHDDPQRRFLSQESEIVDVSHVRGRLEEAQRYCDESIEMLRRANALNEQVRTHRGPEFDRAVAAIRGSYSQTQREELASAQLSAEAGQLTVRASLLTRAVRGEHAAVMTLHRTIMQGGNLRSLAPITTLERSAQTYSLAAADLSEVGGIGTTQTAPATPATFDQQLQITRFSQADTDLRAAMETRARMEASRRAVATLERGANRLVRAAEHGDGGLPVMDMALVRRQAAEIRRLARRGDFNAAGRRLNRLNSRVNTTIALVQVEQHAEEVHRHALGPDGRPLTDLIPGAIVPADANPPPSTRPPIGPGGVPITVLNDGRPSDIPYSSTQTAFDIERVRNEGTDIRTLLDQGSLRSAHRRLEGLGDYVAVRGTRVDVILAHHQNLASSSQLERNFGMREFTTSEYLRSLDETEQHAAEGRHSVVIDRLEGIGNQYRVAAGRQHLLNLENAALGRASDLEDQAQRIRTALRSAPTPEHRDGLSGDAVHDQNVQVVESTVNLGAAARDAESQANIARARAEQCLQARADIQTLEDINPRTGSVVVNALARAGSARGQSAQAYAADMRGLAAALQNGGDEGAMVYLFSHTDLLRRGAMLARTNGPQDQESGMRASVANVLIARADNQTSIEQAQIHAVGWNAAMTMANRYVRALDDVEHLLRSGRVSSQGANAMRINASAFGEEARLASEHSGEVTREIASGRLPSRMRQTLITHLDGVQSANQGFAGLIDTHQAAIRVGDAWTSTTFAGFGYAYSGEGPAYTRTHLNIIPAEQRVLQEAQQNVEEAVDSFGTISGSLEGRWVSQDDARRAFNAALSIADQAINNTSRLINSATDPEHLNHPTNEAELQRITDGLRLDRETFQSVQERAIRQGMGEEAWFRRGEMAGEMILGGLLTATGFGAPFVAAYFLNRAVIGQFDQARAAGGYENLTTFQRVLGGAGIALAGIGFVAPYLGAFSEELVAADRIATEVASEASGALNGATTVSRSWLLSTSISARSFSIAGRTFNMTGRTFSPLMAVNRGLGYAMVGGGLATGLGSIYEMAHSGDPNANWVDYALAGFQAAQPGLMQGMRLAGRYNPELMFGRSIGARAYRASMLGLFGATREHLVQQYYQDQYIRMGQAISHLPPEVAVRLNIAQTIYSRISGGAAPSPEALVGLLQHYCGSDGQIRQFSPLEAADLLAAYTNHATNRLERLSPDAHARVMQAEIELNRPFSSDEQMAAADILSRAGEHLPTASELITQIEATRRQAGDRLPGLEVFAVQFRDSFTEARQNLLDQVHGAVAGEGRVEPVYRYGGHEYAQADAEQVASVAAAAQRLIETTAHPESLNAEQISASLGALGLSHDLTDAVHSLVRDPQFISAGQEGSGVSERQMAFADEAIRRAQIVRQARTEFLPRVRAEQTIAGLEAISVELQARIDSPDPADTPAAIMHFRAALDIVTQEITTREHTLETARQNLAPLLAAETDVLGLRRILEETRAEFNSMSRRPLAQQDGVALARLRANEILISEEIARRDVAGPEQSAVRRRTRQPLQPRALGMASGTESESLPGETPVPVSVQASARVTARAPEQAVPGRGTDHHTQVLEGTIGRLQRGEAVEAALENLPPLVRTVGRVIDNLVDQVAAVVDLRRVGEREVEVTDSDLVNVPQEYREAVRTICRIQPRMRDPNLFLREYAQQIIGTRMVRELDMALSAQGVETSSSEAQLARTILRVIYDPTRVGMDENIRFMALPHEALEGVRATIARGENGVREIMAVAERSHGGAERPADPLSRLRTRAELSAAYNRATVRNLAGRLDGRPMRDAAIAAIDAAEQMIRNPSSTPQATPEVLTAAQRLAADPSFVEATRNAQDPSSTQSAVNTARDAQLRLGAGAAESMPSIATQPRLVNPFSPRTTAPTDVDAPQHVQETIFSSRPVAENDNATPIAANDNNTSVSVSAVATLRLTNSRSLTTFIRDVALGNPTATANLATLPSEVQQAVNEFISNPLFRNPRNRNSSAGRAAISQLADRIDRLTSPREPESVAQPQRMAVGAENQQVDAVGGQVEVAGSVENRPVASSTDEGGATNRQPPHRSAPRRPSPEPVVVRPVTGGVEGGFDAPSPPIGSHDVTGRMERPVDEVRTGRRDGTRATTTPASTVANDTEHINRVVSVLDTTETASAARTMHDEVVRIEDRTARIERINSPEFRVRAVVAFGSEQAADSFIGLLLRTNTDGNFDRSFYDLTHETNPILRSRLLHSMLEYERTRGSVVGPTTPTAETNLRLNRYPPAIATVYLEALSGAGATAATTTATSWGLNVNPIRTAARRDGPDALRTEVSAQVGSLRATVLVSAADGNMGSLQSGLASIPDAQRNVLVGEYNRAGLNELARQAEATNPILANELRNTPVSLTDGNFNRDIAPVFERNGITDPAQIAAARRTYIEAGTARMLAGVDGVVDAVCASYELAGLNDFIQRRGIDYTPPTIPERALVATRALADLVSVGGLQQNIHNIPGFENATITGARYRFGMRGAFGIDVRQPDGSTRRLFLKLEDLSGAQFGEHLLRAEGILTAQHHPNMSYQTGRTCANGQPEVVQYGLMEDIHDLVGTERTVRLPDGRIETVRVRSIALVEDEVINPTEALDNPGSAAHAVTRAVYNAMRTDEGRVRVFEAWASYQSGSRNTLLMDRAGRNSVAALVELPDGTREIIFGAIDTDGITERIETRYTPQGTHRGNDFSVFNRDFTNVTNELVQDFTTGFWHYNSRAATPADQINATEFDVARSAATVANRPEPPSTYTPEMTAARNTAIHDYSGGYVGFGMDPDRHGEATNGRGYSPRPTRNDGRVTIYEEEVHDLHGQMTSPQGRAEYQQGRVDSSDHAQFTALLRYWATSATAAHNDFVTVANHLSGGQATHFVGYGTNRVADTYNNFGYMLSVGRRMTPEHVRSAMDSYVASGVMTAEEVRTMPQTYETLVRVALRSHIASGALTNEQVTNFTQVVDWLQTSTGLNVFDPSVRAAPTVAVPRLGTGTATVGATGVATHVDTVPGAPIPIPPPSPRVSSGSDPIIEVIPPIETQPNVDPNAPVAAPRVNIPTPRASSNDPITGVMPPRDQTIPEPVREQPPPRVSARLRPALVEPEETTTNMIPAPRRLSEPTVEEETRTQQIPVPRLVEESGTQRNSQEPLRAPVSTRVPTRPGLGQETTTQPNTSQSNDAVLTPTRRTTTSPGSRVETRASVVETAVQNEPSPPVPLPAEAPVVQNYSSAVRYRGQPRKAIGVTPRDFVAQFGDADLRFDQVLADPTTPTTPIAVRFTYGGREVNRRVEGGQEIMIGRHEFATPEELANVIRNRIASLPVEIAVEDVHEVVSTSPQRRAPPPVPPQTTEQRVRTEATRLRRLFEAERNPEDPFFDQYSLSLINYHVSRGHSTADAAQMVCVQGETARHIANVIAGRETPTSFEEEMYVALTRNRMVNRETNGQNPIDAASVALSYISGVSERAQDLAVRDTSGRTTSEDEGELNFARFNARANGRQTPTLGDYAHGLLAAHLQAQYPDFFASGLRILQNAHITDPVALQTILPAYLSACVRINSALSRFNQNAVAAAEPVYKLAAALAISHPEAVTSILSNPQGSGLLDLFRIRHPAGESALLGQSAASINSFIHDSSPELRQNAIAAVEMGLADSTRIEPEQRLNYLAACFGNRSLTSGNERDAQFVRSVTEASTQRYRLPILALDPSSHSSFENLANKDFRQALRNDANYRIFIEALTNYAAARTAAETNPVYGPGMLGYRRALGQSFDLMGTTLQSRPEPLTASRTHIFDRLRHLNDVFRYTNMGLLDPEEFNQSMRLMAPPGGHDSRSGAISYDAFERSVDGVISILTRHASTVGVTPEWAQSNIRIYRDMLRFERTMSEFAHDEPQQLSLPQPPDYQVAHDVFIQAATAHSEGRFLEFKYRGFRDELTRVYGSERGSRLFDTWSSENSQVIVVNRADGTQRTFQMAETGGFEDAFYMGEMNGSVSCQRPTGTHFVSSGLVGTIELPWMRQVVVRTPDAQGAERNYRVQLVLVRGENGNPIILVQQPYTAVDLPPGEAAQIGSHISEYLRSRYPDAEIRLTQRTPGEYGTSQDCTFNTGYNTFATGRSPILYLDTNMHRFNTTYGVDGNGLTRRVPGQPLNYPRGWSSVHDAR